MKSIRIITFMTLAVILFSSCGSLSISQKRYSRGINISWFGNRADKGADNKITARESGKGTNTRIANKAENSGSGNGSGENAVSDAMPELPEAVTPVATLPEVSKSEPAAKTEKKTAVRKKSTPFKELRKNIKTLSHLKPSSGKNINAADATNDSDVNLILLVILALLLPPLAVYLYFGELNVHFWINLILCLVVGGIGFASGSISYLGLAVIHALLVVFGIFG